MVLTRKFTNKLKSDVTHDSSGVIFHNKEFEAKLKELTKAAGNEISKIQKVAEDKGIEYGDDGWPIVDMEDFFLLKYHSCHQRNLHSATLRW